MSYDGYQELQNAIVLRAADDYRILLKKQSARKTEKRHSNAVVIRTFFTQKIKPRILCKFGAENVRKLLRKSICGKAPFYEELRFL